MLCRAEDTGMTSRPLSADPVLLDVHLGSHAQAKTPRQGQTLRDKISGPMEGDMLPFKSLTVPLSPAHDPMCDELQLQLLPATSNNALQHVDHSTPSQTLQGMQVHRSMQIHRKLLGRGWGMLCRIPAWVQPTSNRYGSMMLLILLCLPPRNIIIISHTLAVHGVPCRYTSDQMSHRRLSMLPHALCKLFAEMPPRRP